MGAASSEGWAVFVLLPAILDLPFNQVKLLRKFRSLLARQVEIIGGGEVFKFLNGNWGVTLAFPFSPSGKCSSPCSS